MTDEKNLAPQPPKAADVRMSPPPEAVDELALQNVLRKRHCKNWPDVMLQLTKRIQAVNQTWAKIVMQLMTIPGLSLTWRRDPEKAILIVSISIKYPGDVEEVEVHEFTGLQLHEAHQYIEVLLMDAVDHSELIARWLEDDARAAEHKP